jgi:TolB-like protein/Tfp pilus assembly protein PilF
MSIWSAEIKELEIVYTTIKGRFPDLEKELEQLTKTRDANVVMLYSRRCLEVIIADLCLCELKRPRKTEPLKGIIDKLNREEKVPAHIITAMDHLNSLSTYGTHPKDFDPEQVKPVLFNLSTIIKWYLKYKETQDITKAKTIEEKPGHDMPVDTGKLSQKPNRRMILLLSGILLVVAAFIIILFVTGRIGGNKRTKEIEKSIAVLPFINDSPNDSTTYFINGIMEEILNNLQTIKDLRVISRSSVEQFRNSNIPTSPEIAKKLNVNYIVEGSGQKYGNTFRLRVQLIEARTDRHLWAKSYEQPIQETNAIFNIQSRIAKSIATELKAVITPVEKQIIEEIPTGDLEAYDNYLLGLHYYNKDTEADILQAIEYFKKAVAQDPEFALAYTRIASAYTSLIWENWLPEDIYPKAREAAMKALEINDQLSEAHVALASVKLYYDWDLKDAEKEFNKAISLNPNNSGAYDLYSTLLDISCRFKEALEKYKQAMALNPNSEKMRFYYGFKLYRAFAVDSAILIMEKGVEDDSLNAWKHYILGYIYL